MYILRFTYFWRPEAMSKVAENQCNQAKTSFCRHKAKNNQQKKKRAFEDSPLFAFMWLYVYFFLLLRQKYTG